MTAPGELAAALERTDLPPGEGERFAGYGIMAQPFRSGHVLALRRFPHTSIGAGYTSVWHCGPDGHWTMWSDVPWFNSCPRYFGPALMAVEQAAIDVEWPDPRSIHVRIGGILDWRTAIGPTSASRLMTAFGSHLPDPLWRNRAVLAAISRVAGPALRAGAVRLQGQVPSGQWFRVKIPRIWATTEADATVHSEDLGPAGPAQPQRWLGGFAVPNPRFVRDRHSDIRSLPARTPRQSGAHYSCTQKLSAFRLAASARATQISSGVMQAVRQAARWSIISAVRVLLGLLDHSM